MVGRVIDQTERRVLHGEVVPAGEKLVSLFAPHTDIIVKDRRDIHYGHKLTLTAGFSGMVLDWVVEDCNPADSTLVTRTIERLKGIYGRVPRQTAFDGGYTFRKDFKDAKALGVRDVAFSQKRGLEVLDTAKSQWIYRRLRNFRAGIEAGISFLKRCFGHPSIYSTSAEPILIDPPITPRWNHGPPPRLCFEMGTGLGPWFLSHHPSLPRISVRGLQGGAVGWILGYPIDGQGLLQGNGASIIASGEPGGFQSAMEELGGRFLGILAHPTSPRVYPDACGSYSSVYCPEQRLAARRQRGRPQWAHTRQQSVLPLSGASRHMDERSVSENSSSAGLMDTVEPGRASTP